HLKATENGQVDVAATNHGEGIGRRKIAGAWEFADSFLAGIHEVGVNFGLERVRADAEHAIFGLHDDIHAFGNEIGNECGHADAEIDVVAVAQFASDALGDAFAFLFVGQGHKKFTADSL